jgi:hypothetical protein
VSLAIIKSLICQPRISLRCPPCAPLRARCFRHVAGQPARSAGYGQRIAAATDAFSDTSRGGDSAVRCTYLLVWVRVAGAPHGHSARKQDRSKKLLPLAPRPTSPALPHAPQTPRRRERTATAQCAAPTSWTTRASCQPPPAAELASSEPQRPAAGTPWQSSCSCATQT